MPSMHGDSNGLEFKNSSDFESITTNSLVIGHMEPHLSPSQNRFPVEGVRGGRVREATSPMDNKSQSNWFWQRGSSTASRIPSWDLSSPEADFKLKILPSAEQIVPAKGCLKKPVPKDLYEPSSKTVRWDETTTMKLIEPVTGKDHYYRGRHSDDYDCDCKFCLHSQLEDGDNDTNTVTIETLSMRIRGNLSNDEETLEIDKALLKARFNCHRMAGEAFQGPHSYFLTDLFVKNKSLDALALWRRKYAAEESALELMRHKRRKGTFFKIKERGWQWLDLDPLAPEIRSSEPRTELDIHWETVEDSQMKGFSLGKESNIRRTRKERSAILSGSTEGVHFPRAGPLICEPVATGVPEDPDVEMEDVPAEPMGRVPIRPLVRNLLA